MYFAVIRYKVPRDEIESLIEEHREFLQDGYEKGYFIVSGPLLDFKGGVIFSTITRRGDFEQILNQDPLIINQVASFETFGFEPTKFDSRFAAFLTERDKEEIEILPHDPHWYNIFEEEKKALSRILNNSLIDLHHIGSTSIPGIYAKPIIDILPVVDDIRHVDTLDEAFKSLGYEVKREFGIPGRRFFTKRLNGKRTFNVHIFQKGHADINRHLLFRDYMRVHPEDAEAYSNLKRTLVQNFPTDIEKYCWGKNDFVKSIEEKATNWSSRE